MLYTQRTYVYVYIPTYTPKYILKRIYTSKHNYTCLCLP